MRKMASIQRLDNITSIDGADQIVCGHVGGWQVVIKKDEFVAGDLVVFCEIDSWIPTKLAPFLSKGKEPREYNSVKGERLRTVRLRGQLSQGLILSTDVIPANNLNWAGPEGVDVSELLNIQKWEMPVNTQLQGVARGNFPSCIPKTNEERVQNLSKELNSYLDMTWEVTEKLEGSSATFALVGEEFHVCSRNLSLKETEGNSFWSIAKKYNIEQKMCDNGWYDTAIQCELVGPGVQGNHYELKEIDCYVFAIYNIRLGKYMPSKVRRSMVEYLEMKHVPIFTIAKLDDILVTVDRLVTPMEKVLKFADGNSWINPKKLREGVVFKNMNGQEHWKAVSNNYLLKEK